MGLQRPQCVKGSLRVITESRQLPQGPEITYFDVAGLLHLPDGRYLVQLRDDFEGLALRDHWGLFGGRVDGEESLEEAMVRELQEELAFTPQYLQNFTEICFARPGRNPAIHQKTFFAVPITEKDVSGMVQSEGAGKRLVTVEEFLLLPRIVPWDSVGLIVHGRLKELGLSPP